MSKIYITQDDHEILDYITDAGIKHDNDNEDRAFTFLLKDNLHLVIFFSAEGDKGFLMFRIDDVRNNVHELSNLTGMLRQMNAEADSKIMRKALSQATMLETAGLAAELFKAGNPLR